MSIELPLFYPIIDTEFLAKQGIDPFKLLSELLAAGARMVQYRHKSRYGPNELEQVRALTRAVQRAGGKMIVNDRADLALLAGADGVHVGQEDLPPAAVRDLVGPNRIIGSSTHNDVQLRAAAGEPVDYLAIGPIFATGSKDKPDPVVGVEELKRLRLLTAKPLVAIGGITRANAPQVWAAGADSVAVISDLVGQNGQPTASAWMALTARVHEQD
jgi:thiamine-phosphate pyrophosphorylase